MTDYRIGVDIGGTFTDIVFLDDGGRVLTKKISSSVDNYAQAIVDGLTEVFADTGMGGEQILEVLHGTTVASNAILELKGARVGLIASKGFRDILEIRTNVLREWIDGHEIDLSSKHTRLWKKWRARPRVSGQ